MNGILTLSGGIDSVVLAHKLVKDGVKPLCMYIDYGSISRKSEIKAAQLTAKDLDLQFQILNFDLYKNLTKAYILGNKEDYEQGAMFWLEGRNAIIGIILSILAGSMGIKKVYFGINASDNINGEYLDTDDRFVSALNTLLLSSCKSKVKVEAPWLDMNFTKVDIIKLGNEYGIDWKTRTHSCSNTKGKPCLDYYACESCYDRRESFEEAGLHDPFFKGR